MIQEYDPEDSPYSFGTTPIYNTLFKMLTSKGDETDIITINLSAIVRNVSGKTNMQQEYKEAKEKSFPFNTLVDDIVKETVKEMKLLVNDIVQMMNEVKTPLPKYIFTYLADYKKVIPSAYYRAVPPGKQHVDMAEDKLRSMYKPGKNTSIIDGVNIVEIYNYGRLCPFRIIEKEIRNIKNQHNIVMISNHPLDYHICHYVSKWADIKSYTGAIQDKNQLGEKVFGHACLPFTEKLHIFMGDKTDVKPCIKPQLKDKILEVAERDNWQFKSTEYTDKRLNEMNCVQPYVL